MFAKLKGTVDFFGIGYLVIDVNGVGYKVFCNEATLGKASSQNTLELFIYTHVKEDQLSLIGFETQEELELFELLISVSGVGPKAALNILNIASADVVKTAIVNQDSSILTQVSGIGKKTAERLILELQNKIKNFSAGSLETAQGNQDVVEALVAMGYNISEAREAAQSVKEVKDVSEKIKLALKSLAKKN
jgi:Holliday junction DNA helicase RuvA